MYLLNISCVFPYRIWHDNGGKNPSWYFSRMQVTDMQTQDQYFFINDQWLAVEHDDGLVSMATDSCPYTMLCLISCNTVSFAL